MNQEWILQTKETRRAFAEATWVPLRASRNDEQGEVRKVGYVSEYFGCGSVAFPPEHREVAERLSWSDIGIGHNVQPYAYEDGHYSPIDQYQYNDKEPIGVELVFEHRQPVVGGTQWILNPDLVVALHLIKDGGNWVRPEEDFVIVAREVLDEKDGHRLIEIKREFLMDYLAARNLSLRLSYYRQRVENVLALEGSAYENLDDSEEERDGGRFELRVRSLDDVFGGSWATFRAWRTDVDEDEDAPVMGPESDDNTDYETGHGRHSGFDGVRVEGEFWRDEWIEHRGQSVRVRGDADRNLPQFIVETDGMRMSSSELDYEDVGRWLWFRSSIVNELLGHRGFSLGWYTAETGGIRSTSGYVTHFGVNSSDLVTVYAHDVARLAAWEQHIWAAHNVVPDGKVSNELLSAQVKAQVAPTHAVEEMLFESMRMLEGGFRENFGVGLYTHEIDDVEVMQHVSRFASKDQASLLRLAKELVRVFSDRLDVRALRKLSTHAEKEKLGSNKLLQDILAQKVGAEKARRIFGPIAGTYDMRVGDAHPTSSKIGEALKLAEIDVSRSFMRQGEQLIHNFGRSVWWTGKLLFGESQERGA
ncbi:hypothetical protein V4E86_22380 [Burkholderia pseudomallei]|uniref:hypothetical protein n=2 Tax=Burkholderia pseudomallei TaxID=28450 RepID=UPI000536B796|nr:hypothetical protein [Burkholderia pseudomallei]AJX20694.1 hypothetical protein BG17_4190 [Burkholderia pseudomallei MSHR491]AYE30592.1 hypothetical protein CNX72_25135 [Burkholderia pseudomallei]KGU95485.1 hypothetical protein X888_143 [Burkholderia pseudomallei MSHR4377]KGW82497.1 hypothetical protein Y034_6306 [Burkholderia pseudomallei MSHR449]KJR92127.1 hypothetical protein VP95_19510 [Burkholderia pseudomallei]